MRDVILHDGLRFQLDELVTLAKNAGSYVLALPYMASILYHAARTNQPQLAEVCNEIRAHYKLGAFAAVVPASVQNLPSGTMPADVARRRWRGMTDEARRDVLRGALSELRLRWARLFEYKECWIGIFLVVHDRLDGRVTKKDFHTFAESVTPDDWPERLRIGVRTMSNFGRSIVAELREEAYFDMGEGNPFQELCELFWQLVEDRLLRAA